MTDKPQPYVSTIPGAAIYVGGDVPDGWWWRSWPSEDGCWSRLWPNSNQFVEATPDLPPDIDPDDGMVRVGWPE